MPRMSTSTHAVIAVRGGETAKSRLSACLNAPQRDALVSAMLMDMLTSLSALEAIDQIWVVTPTPEIAVIAAAAGAKVLRDDTDDDLNHAFEKACATISGTPNAERILLLPGDLPLLKADDVAQSLLGTPADIVVIARAGRDGGTAALALPIPCDMRLAFGANSFARHVANAAACGLACRTVEAPSISLDIDCRSDLDALLAQDVGGWTGRFLNNWRTAA